ncbi:MAG TPA: hypothetical protein VGI58_13815 [Streptosporangiaceae bacterium]|jgi:thiol:disulfide interchange protein
MGLVALGVWIATAGFGMYLLSIWLIEYDREYQKVTATRLPPPVLVAHIVLALGSLVVWGTYLILDDDELLWIAFLGACLASSLGLIMAARWLTVYRAKRAVGQERRSLVLAGQYGEAAVLDAAVLEGPPERNFPLPVVITHGAFAAATLALVLLTAFRGS